jgi:hypothetical protein
MLRWEMQTYIHGTSLTQRCLHNVWRSPVPRADEPQVSTWRCELRMLRRGPRVTWANFTFTLMSRVFLCTGSPYVFMVGARGSLVG